MLDINFIRQNPEEVKRGIAAKKAPAQLVDDFLRVDGEWRALTAQADQLRNEQKKAGAERNMEEGKRLKIELQKMEGELNERERERNAILIKIPNLQLADVPEGKGSEDNVVLSEVGEK